MSALPIGLRRDIRASFGSYANGCRRADDLLSRAGDAEAVDGARRRSPVGKLLPDALDVHRTALEALDPPPRVYEGCARADLGEIDGADLIKLHRHSGKVSYLVDPDFDADPHPALLRSIKLNLRTRDIESSDYAASANPPVLHRKETFLLPDDPRRSKLDRRTRPEQRAGPLDETASIAGRVRAGRPRGPGPAGRGRVGADGGSRGRSGIDDRRSEPATRVSSELPSRQGD
jgi:DNA phosphorothioation-associated putative methyltransferase